ncbi:hypothetical protein FB446DRAFT_36752 [Lentinula raphanica]|nr:hypothetical protein FB446DRAFT_36752 [Lentinula raphanica]
MRNYPGSGSQTSPIFISDDEDGMSASSRRSFDSESSVKTGFKLTIPHSPSHRGSHKSTSQSADTKSKMMRVSLQGRQVGETVSKTRKRKRDQSDLSADTTVSRSTHPLPSEPAFTASKSKRNKHAERYNRRSGNEAHHRQVFDDAAFEPESYSLPYSLGTAGPSGSSVPVLEDLPTLSMESPAFSSSEWVNSMAQASDSSYMQSYTPAPWNTFLSPPWTCQPLLPDFDQPLILPPSSSISISSLPEKPVRNIRTIPAQKSLPTNTIGMPYTKDPEGRRGDFKPSSHTVFESKPHITYPHRPEPSRCLVMDQLPKLSRTPQWLNDWSQNACGAEPVFLAIDSSSAKALLEFSSSDHAEKAWGSPILGKDLRNLSIAELKGKPRVDLIKVWWYRSTSLDLIFARKELEEGEIEDDEPLVDGRKESKKEKRARLAKMVKDDKLKLVDFAPKRGSSALPDSPLDAMVTEPYPLNTNMTASPPLPTRVPIVNAPVDSLTPSHQTHETGLNPLGFQPHPSTSAHKPSAPKSSPVLTARPVLSLSSPSSTTPSTVLADSSAAKIMTPDSSVVMRSLLERQRELQERIAQSKQEIERKQALASKSSDTAMQPLIEQVASPALLDEPPSTSTSISTSESPQLDTHDLRRMALASQQSKNRNAETTSTTDSTISRTGSDFARTSNSGSPDANSGTPITSIIADIGLDDLAVTFIEESIQTSTSRFMPPPPAPPASAAMHHPNRSNLMARREQLEYQIAETKRLMNMLSQTTTKQGKDQIMAQIRQLSRSQEQPPPEPAPPPLMSKSAYPSFLVKSIEPMKSLWPESIPDGGILILSDDEDDDSDHDD